MLRSATRRICGTNIAAAAASALTLTGVALALALPAQAQDGVAPPSLAALSDIGVVQPALSAGVATSAAADDPLPTRAADLVVHYPFNETSGTVVADASGNGLNAEIVDNTTGTAVWLNGRGLRLPGGNSSNLSAFPAVRMPDSLLAGLADVTIAYDVLASGTAAGGPVYTFGQNSENGGYLVGTPGSNNSATQQPMLTQVPHQASIAGPGTAAQVVAAPAGLLRPVWKHVAVTVRGGDATNPGEMVLYEDGVRVATNGELTLKPSDITSPTSYIGRSNITSGTVRQFAGSIKDFRVYSAVLTAPEIEALSAALAPGNLQEIMDGVTTLGDTSALVQNITLPSAPGLTWSTSDPDVITATGAITRPPAGGSDATATLTAHFTHRGLTDSKDFEVTVLKRVAFTEAELLQGVVHRFKLDETSGTTLANSGSAGSAANATLVNPDKATLTGDGVRFNPDSYENALAGGYVSLPNNITAGFSNLTVDYDVRVDPANVGNHQMWSFGSKAGSCDVDTGAQGAIFASNTAARPGDRFRVAVGNQNLMQGAPSRLLEGAWKHVTYTQSLNADGTSWTGTVYLDGMLHTQLTNLTTPPSVNAIAGTNCNFLARSQASGDYSFRGTLKDFRVYDRAVSLDEALALADATVSSGATDDAAAIDLGLTSAIVRDIVLPKVGSVAGSSISWASSDPSVVEVDTPPALFTARKVDIIGRITRPAVGEPDATAVLTATVRKGANDAITREFPVTVRAEFNDAQAVDRDKLDLELYATDNVRGNMNLPAAGEFGTTITWESTSELITPTGVVTRPAFGHPDVEATLTATIAKGAASQTKSFPVTIKSAPRVEEFERYFLGYFKGENIADGEQIMFATSNGNSALDWTGLTGGRPSLISQLGDQGLRDPHIVRSPDGDTFYMIATDLNWYDQGGFNINDTQSIEVFESNDLVNWTPQRHVRVAPPNAAAAFAPESLWVEEIGAYAVFWAQALFSNGENRTGQGNAQMWYNTTRDFQTFSGPKVWQDPAPLSRIDTTGIKVGDHYYRVTKNEAGGEASDIFSEKHTDFLDSNINNWTLLGPALGRTTWLANQGYEGPIIFRANPGDTACAGQFYLWADQYTNGGGYQGACHENIEAPTWNAKTITMTNAGVPHPRHGTVTPITLREWNAIRGIPNSDVATTTEMSAPASILQGDTPTITATVEAADSFETGGRVRFTVGEWSELAYLDDGVASVTLPSTIGVGSYTVTAEFLGHDYLEASQDSQSIEVRPGEGASVVKAGFDPASVASGRQARLTVVVTSARQRDTAPFATGLVTVVLGGVKYTATLTKGVATLNLPTAGLAAGNHVAQVSYPGDRLYAPSEGSANLIVRKAVG